MQSNVNRGTIFSLLLLLLPPALFCGPPLLKGEMFAYRDSARFYYRQFEWNRDQWRAGNVPLWNPQENLGVPVVAEATSSVFYPFQLLFLIPGISVATAFVGYAAVHVYLAGVGSYLLGRSLGCRPGFALLAALAYAGSGSLLFQTSNIVFLVGGCWLPYCVWMSWRLVQDPGWLPALGLGWFTALPVLGGDPQTAYHVGLIAGLLILFQVFSGKRDGGGVDGKRIVGLHLLAALLAIGIAAIQVLPAWQATRDSTRAYTDRARTVWELGETPAASWAPGIFGHPLPGTHHDHLYQFSQPPWSVMELLWPNVSGRIGSEESRWADFLPGASRMWTPSLYCGLPVLIFFLSALGRKSRWLRDRWLKTGWWLFALGSTGWYGLGWLVHEIGWSVGGVDPARSAIGAPVGGVYWFLVVWLPGYVNFRYPAKLFLVATLLMGLLAGLEFQRIVRRREWSRLRRVTIGVLAVSLAAWVGLYLFSLPVNGWLDSLALRTATEWGPFDSRAAWTCMLGGILHACVACVLVLMLINQSWPRSRLVAALILLTLGDLVVANRGLLVTARGSLWERPQLALQSVVESPTESVRFYRTDPMVWSTKNSWFRQAAKNRTEQIVDFEVQTLMPRHHLAARRELPAVGMVESFRTLESLRFATVMAWLKQWAGVRTGDSYDVQLAPEPRALGRLAVEYLLIPRWGRPNLPDEAIVAELENHEALLVRNPESRERFRIVESVTWIPPIADVPAWLGDPEHGALVGHMLSGSETNDRALVEVSDAEEATSHLEPWTTPANAEATGQRIRLIRETATELELEVAARSGLLVMADAFDDDWSAWVLDSDGEWVGVPLWRTDLVMRGVPVGSMARAAGQAEIRLRLVYRPRWVIRGAVISLVSLAGVVLLFGWGIVRRRKW